MSTSRSTELSAVRPCGAMDMRQMGSAFLLLVGLGAASGASVGDDRYFNVVRGFADAMLERGRDTYGREKTPLFASALDRHTMRVREDLPVPAGIRNDDRSVTAANPMHDQNFYRLLYALSDLTKDRRYATAADDALRYFFTHCQSPATGLMAWGEHIGWDIRSDGVLHARKKHEFFRPWVLWDKCYELAPEQSRKFARGLWDHQIYDQSVGNFSRHSNYHRHGPEDGHHEFPRHAGFYIATWADAYTKTRDPVFVRAIQTVVNYFEPRRLPNGGFPCHGNRDTVWWDSDLSWAIDVWAASSRMPAALAAKMQREARKTDAAFLKQFAQGLPRAPENLWVGSYGTRSTAMLAMICYERHLQLPQNGMLKLVLQTAHAYLTAEPNPDSYPGPFGAAIKVLMVGYRHTKDKRYLRRAEQLGNVALAKFWERGNPLPRAGMRYDHYEAITGADTLAVSLLELWSLGRRRKKPLTFSWIDR